MQSVSNSWASNDPAGAAQWAASFAAGNAKTSAYANIARNWANNDVTQASAWLTQLPADSAKDAAIVSFSNQVFDEDPQAAYQWAESVGDATQRQQITFALLSRWVRSDPTNATPVVQQSSLSEAQKAQLLQRSARN